MPRIARVVAVGAPHHVTQRGNNRQQVFFSQADRRIYLALLRAQAERYKLDILGYCLMSNHVHLVVIPNRGNSLAKALGRAHYDYTIYLNGRRNRSGHLWQNRFFSTATDRDHLVSALRYVDLNPVRANMVERAADYLWSSARAHINGADPEGLIHPIFWREICPLRDWAGALTTRETDRTEADRIRQATRTGRPLASQEFVHHLERTLDRPLSLRKRGRNPAQNRQMAAKSAQR